MIEEVATGGDRSGNADVLLLVVVNVTAGREEGVDVRGRLLDVALDIHGEAGSLGECEAEV